MAAHTPELKRLRNDVQTLKKKVAALERKNKKRSTVPRKKSPSLHATTDPLQKFIGAFDSKGSDWVEKHDRYLGENLLKELRGSATDA
ncbi:MAG: hypothetical protein HY070_10845 [Chloroflexi bacterium]|nr:hypothetical protein [Chloroflexota bacterium]MBI3741199.1 hypothetical protein [Chloroflexota bacterium]